MSQFDELTPASQSGKEASECAQCGKAVDPLRAARVRIIWGQFARFCSASCADEYEPGERSDRGAAATPAPRIDSQTAEALSDDETVPSSDRRPPMRAVRERQLEKSATSDASAASAILLPKREERDAKSAAVDVTFDRKQQPSVDDRDEQARSQSSARSPEPVEGNPTDTDRSRPGGKSVQGQAKLPDLPDEQLIEAPQDPSRYLTVSVAAAFLGLALVLLQPSPISQGVRLLLTLIACAALDVWYRAKPLELQSLVWFTRWCVVMPTAAALAAIVAVSVGSETGEAFVGLAGVLAAGAAGAHALLLRAGAATVSAHRETLGLLGENTDDPPMHTGQDIVIHAGERTTVDVSITAGSGELSAWAGCETPQPVKPGDFVYAGARLLSGQLRATVRWVGNDRHWLRLLVDPARRADVHYPVVQLVHRGQLRLAVLGSTASLGLSFAFGQDVLTALLQVLTVAGTVMTPLIVAVPALRCLQTVLRALQLGIVFKSAQALERASKITQSVFCARGTLLLGEPELTTVLAVGSLGTDQVLALAAGAELSIEHPLSAAVRRAAHTRGVRPDAVRNPQSDSGLGITAVTSDGNPLVVGGRALMLREKISIARVETKINELEAAGRTVLLVARDRALVGILGLQDGLRPGARAAVQHLIDVNIEPVLMSGDSRLTCETLGRTIDIDHVRPEVLPQDRGGQVERLRSAGASVAVIGRSPTDDIALSAGDLSVSLPAFETKGADFDVELASDEVQKAALALRLAHLLRRRVQKDVGLVAAAMTLGLVLVLALDVPAPWAPLLASTALAAVLASKSLSRATAD